MDRSVLKQAWFIIQTDTYNGSIFEFYGQSRRLHAGTGVIHGRSLLALRALMGIASKLIHRSEQRSRCLRGYPHRESDDRLWQYTSCVEMIIRYGNVTFMRHLRVIQFNILRQKLTFTYALNSTTLFTCTRIFVVSRCGRDPLF